MLSSSTPRPVSRALAQIFAHAGCWTWVCTSFASFAAPTADDDDDGDAGSTSTMRTTAVPSNTRRTLSASQAGARWVVLGPAADAEEGDEDEEPEKACQNALPRRCTSVCEAIDASAAWEGVGDDVDDTEVEVEPSLGVEGGVGYVGAKEDVTTWCLPLREERVCVAEELRKDAAVVK
jgi:hypothetical protein